MNHMGMDKTKLLECESIYWPGINSNTEKYIKVALHILNSANAKENIMHHEMPRKPSEVVGADIFTLHNRNYLCIVDYHRKFPIIKKTEDLSTDSLILACNIFLFGIWLTKKNIVRRGSNFISEKFEKFCKKLNIDHAASSSYHQRNNQVEVCIKGVK